MEPTQEELSILSTAKPYTMTSGERLLHTIRTVRQLDKNNIKGDIVECGVWKGGHPIAAYLANTNTQRHFWLYDTFDGMTIPTQHDYKIKQKTKMKVFPSCPPACPAKPCVVIRIMRILIRCIRILMRMIRTCRIRECADSENSA